MRYSVTEVLMVLAVVVATSIIGYHVWMFAITMYCRLIVGLEGLL